MLLAFVLAAFSLPTQDAHAQGTISGRVTDAETGNGLPGVNVVIVGRQQGASTDAEGAYTIEDVPPGTYTVRASFIGFVPLTREDVEVVNGQTTEVNFALGEAPVELDDVTVVGYGAVRREDVTGSVGVVDLENLSARPLTSPDQALQGQVAGVEVLTSNGIPGGGPQIRVRGTGNIGAGSHPLYVVDGFALPQPESDAAALERNPLADIPPEDIESITVLKDASATAIYGSRASAGVVIITTKSGSAGAYEVNVSARSGFNQTMDRTVIQSATAREFAQFQNVIWSGRVLAGEAEEIPEPYRDPSQYGEGTNWWDEITRVAQQHNVQVSVSGGSPNLRSYFSGSYTREEGVMRNSSFDRVTLRANIETNPSDRVSAGLRVAPTFTRRNINWAGGEGRGGAGGTAWMITPLAPVYLEDGSYNPQPGDANYPGWSPGVWSQPNPVLWLENEENEQNALRALGSAFAAYEFVPGLSLRQSINADYNSSAQTQFRPSIIGFTRSAPPTVPSGLFASGSYLNWLSETTLNYSGELGPGRLEGLAGFTAQEETRLTSEFDGNFPDDDIRTLNVATDLDGETEEEGWTLLSGLGRLNYSLLDRFVFTGTIRSDGSSRFGANRRWGTFPSGAVAWNLHNERFMSGLRESVPELRARLSYGVTGNNQIGNYSSLGVVDDSDYILGGNVTAGRVLATLGNPELSWEKTREVNFGVDAALYNYNVRFSLELYQRNTTQLLLDRELPYVTGFTTVTQNLGEVRNRGIELSLHTVNVQRDNYAWLTDFNLALNRNQITSLPGGNDVFYTGPGPTAYIHRVGLPMGSYVGYLIDGLWVSQEQIEAAGLSTDDFLAPYSGVVPGSFIIRDLNNDNVITERAMDPVGDFAYLGDAYPDLVFGITNTISIGPVDVRALITGSFGGDNLRSEFYRTARNIDGLFVVDSDYIQNMWIPVELVEANPSILDWRDRDALMGDGLTPTALGGAFGRQQYRDQNHTWVLSDASNIWVRNIMIRYNFRSGMLSGSNIYLTIDNPFLFSPYQGNPNVTDDGDLNQYPGMDFGNYPIPRSFTFGLEVDL